MLAVVDSSNSISIVCPTIVLTILPGVAGAGIASIRLAGVIPLTLSLCLTSTSVAVVTASTLPI